jgi:hypothetical protein
MGRGHDDGYSNAFHAKTQKNFTQRAQSKMHRKEIRKGFLYSLAPLRDLCDFA